MDSSSLAHDSPPGRRMITQPQQTKASQAIKPGKGSLTYVNPYAQYTSLDASGPYNLISGSKREEPTCKYLSMSTQIILFQCLLIPIHTIAVCNTVARLRIECTIGGSTLY